MANTAALRATTAAQTAAPASKKVQLARQSIIIHLYHYSFSCFEFWCSCDVVAEIVVTVLCSDGVSECPDGTTCCETTEGKWACCPLPKVQNATPYHEWDHEWQKSQIMDLHVLHWRPVIVTLWCFIHANRPCAALTRYTAALKEPHVMSSIPNAFTLLPRKRCQCGQSSLPEWEQLGKTRKVTNFYWLFFCER